LYNHRTNRYHDARRQAHLPSHGGLAEFERDLIRERTNAGLVAARARGRVGGRPRKLRTHGKVALARRMFADQSHSIPEICAALAISRATLYRYVKETESPT